MFLYIVLLILNIINGIFGSFNNQTTATTNETLKDNSTMGVKKLAKCKYIWFKEEYLIDYFILLDKLPGRSAGIPFMSEVGSRCIGKISLRKFLIYSLFKSRRWILS